MMLFAFSLMAAAPILGVSLWIVDEAYGERVAPRLRARVNDLGDRLLHRR